MSASFALFISDVEVLRGKELIRCSLTRHGPSSSGEVPLGMWGSDGLCGVLSATGRRHRNLQ